MSQNKKPAKAPSAYSNHFEAMKTLAKCRGIPRTCKLVLLDILAYASSKGGIAYTSQATIAEDIGLTRHQVMRAIKGLVQVQALTIVYQTKQAARDAGISIKGDPILDKDGVPVQENLNTMQVLFGWDGMCKKVINRADQAILEACLKAKPVSPATAKKAAKAAKPGIAGDTIPGIASDTIPRIASDTIPRIASDTTLVSPVLHEHLTVIEHRLDSRNEKESLKASLSQTGTPAPPADKEKAKALVTETRHPPLTCLEFLKAFKDYNPKWVWTRTSVARFKQNWESHSDFRSLSSKIILALQTNTQLPIFCPNLDPNYLFYSKDSHDLMIWEKLLTGVAYFTSTKQPTPEPDWNLLLAQQAARFAAEDISRERHSTMLKSLTDAEWEERCSSPDISAWDKARLDGNTTTEKQDPGAGKPALAVSGPSGPDPAT